MNPTRSRKATNVYIPPFILFLLFIAFMLLLEEADTKK
jgi:hypothetical protein